jgi:hypothetical protein
MATFSPAFWPMIAAACAVLTLAIAMVWRANRDAYHRGVTDQRITAIENAQKDTGALDITVATLAANVASLNASIARFDRVLERIDVRGVMLAK